MKIIHTKCLKQEKIICGNCGENPGCCYYCACLFNEGDVIDCKDRGWYNRHYHQNCEEKANKFENMKIVITKSKKRILWSMYNIRKNKKKIDKSIKKIKRGLS